MKEPSLQYKRTDTSDTEITFEVTIPVGAFKEHYQLDLEQIAKGATMSGFRKGKVPIDMVESKHGEQARKEALQHLLSEYASDVMEKEGIHPAAAPVIDVASVNADQDIVFTMNVPVIPTVTLPELSKLDVKRPDISVTEKEVETVLKEIWEQHRGKFKDKTDEWVKQSVKGIGFTAKTLKDLRAEIKDAMRAEKERVAEESFSHEALRAAIKLSKIQLPEILIKREAEEREVSFISTLQQMHSTIEDFCKTREVTLEELRKRWRDDATEAIQSDVFLATYALKHSLQVSKTELEKEIALIRDRSQNSSDALFDNPEWRGYIERVLLKRKAFLAFLDDVRSLFKSSDVVESDAKKSKDSGHVST